MEIFWLVAAGLMVGALGRLLHPRRDLLGWVLTLALAVAAAVSLGLLLPARFWSYLAALSVAALLVLAVGRVERRGERASRR